MKVSYDRENPRDYEAGRIIPGMGRSRREISCPFCSTRFTAYLWSLAGGGKKCPGCGAIHFREGYAYPVLKK